MRNIGIIFCIIAVSFMGLQIALFIYSDYRFDNEISYAWELADKSSTLEIKSKYIKEFISNLDKSDFSEYNALFLKTPDNNVQNNINAVRSLNNRLDEIKDLDPESFAYQTAIQQITEQEQGQAQEMLNVIYGGWILGNGYFIVWEWIGVLFFSLSGVILSLGIIFIVINEGML